jgi:hypothetical protein
MRVCITRNCIVVRVGDLLAGGVGVCVFVVIVVYMIAIG